jgi:hypothetical protein
MKNFRYIFFTAIFALCAFSAITYTSCNGDKCKDISCRNGGSCNDGTCTCVNGYNGKLCENPPDFCYSSPCQNGGTCASSICSCPTGYEGTYCEKLTRDKYIGAWAANDHEVATFNNFSYAATIQAGDQINQVKIYNFANQFSNPVIATVTSGAISVAFQSPGNNNIAIKATGVLNPNDNNSLQWVAYQIINTTTNDTADFEAVWQGDQ